MCGQSQQLTFIRHPIMKTGTLSFFNVNASFVFTVLDNSIFYFAAE